MKKTGFIAMVTKIHYSLTTLNIIAQTQNYEAKVTPSRLVNEWLPCVSRLAT